MTRQIMLTLMASLMLSACAVGPDPFASRAASVPAGFAEGSTGPAGQVTTRQWWAEYRDPMLGTLVTRGLAQNLDTMAAIERIRAAEADVAAAGPLASSLSGSTTAARQRGDSGSGVAYTSTSALSAAWVFDIFGGQMRARQGAEAALGSAEAQAETVRLAWLASTVAAYSDARYLQQALALTRETISARTRTVDVTRTQVELGSATDFELAQAEALLETAKADLPNYEAQFNAAVFTLATLLNEPAGPLLAQMQKGAAALRIPAGPGAGTPADLLRNRPDIRSAELDLVASLASLGVAEADLLPSITLTGSVTDQAGTTSWGFGPQLSIPIFNQGALQAAKARRAAEAREAEITWRATILSAVEEVQTAQSNLRRDRQRVARLAAAAEASDRAYAIAVSNYEAGSLPITDLLDVDRSRASARLALASAQNDAAKEWAALQIALGAGAR